MIIDGHIHIRPGKPDPDKLLGDLNDVGIDGGLLISLEPGIKPAAYRLENLREWTSGHKNFMPFFWIDPLETDALGQVRKAIDSGVAGFKIICDRFYPGDRPCMSICEMAADAGKPVLFHSGILWDGTPSSEYCRPVHFESMLKIDGLRFSLAHIGWPWCDEMIAVFGKFQNFKSRNPGSKNDMFIDMTPGTPLVYRKEVISKLFLTGYDIKRNLVFGLRENGYRIIGNCGEDAGQSVRHLHFHLIGGVAMGERIL